MVLAIRQPKTLRRVDRRFSNAMQPWTEGELEVLGEKYGIISDKALAKRLGRSVNALHVAAVRKLHQSHSTNFYTARNVADELGVKCSKTVVFWQRMGWLVGRQCHVHAGINFRWMFHYEHIEHCLRKRPYLCDLKTMPLGFFRTIVQEEWNKDRWYSCDEAAAFLGLKTHDAVQRYIRKGWLPAVKRPGGPWQGRWVIRHSTLQEFLANDPRPTKREIVQGGRRQSRLSRGLPVCLSVHWSIVCKACGKRVTVMARPSLRKSARVEAEFARMFNTDGKCSHGVKCAVGF